MGHSESLVCVVYAPTPLGVGVHWELPSNMGNPEGQKSNYFRRGLLTRAAALWNWPVLPEITRRKRKCCHVPELITQGRASVG